VATYPRRHRTLTVAVLHILRDASSRGEKLTLSEIEVRLTRDRYGYRGRYYYESPQPRRWLGEVLKDLEESRILDAGLVSDGSAGDGTIRWALNRDWMSGDGGGRNNNDDNFDAGDGGGGGLREVLAHRYLFSLSEPDFNDALDNALRIEQ
jgi:hypothetical protein